MDPKADFYNDLITNLPDITLDNDVVKEFINSYTICFNAATRDVTTGVVTRECNTIPFFDPAKANFNQLITNLSAIFSNLKNDITTLNNSINVKLQQIDSEKELKDANSGIFTNINTSNSGAKIMIDDYKKTYNAQYYKNVELVIGIILLIGISSKIFRK